MEDNVLNWFRHTNDNVITHNVRRECLDKVPLYVFSSTLTYRSYLLDKANLTSSDRQMADLLVPLHTHAMELGEITKASYPDAPSMQSNSEDDEEAGRKWLNKQRVLMHGHQGWNVRHSLCHIYMIYVYIWVVYSFCLFCCLSIIVTTQFVALLT